MGAFSPASGLHDFHLRFEVRFNEVNTSSWIRLLELRAGAGSPKLFWLDAEPKLYFLGGRTGLLDIDDGHWHAIDNYASLDKNGMLFVYIDDQICSLSTSTIKLSQQLAAG
jgi:hypothetical protein